MSRLEENNKHELHKAELEPRGGTANLQKRLASIEAATKRDRSEGASVCSKPGTNKVKVFQITVASQQYQIFKVFQILISTIIKGYLFSESF